MLCINHLCIFQSTHPLRDATRKQLLMYAWMLNFNPRTPYGMRRYSGYSMSNRAVISIHAPLTGCDFYGNNWQQLGFNNFNPRTPYGMRRQVSGVFALIEDISIHAPLTGCDASFFSASQVQAIFQSTHPLRDATEEIEAKRNGLDISIHAPLTGCDRI